MHVFKQIGFTILLVLILAQLVILDSGIKFNDAEFR
jgi:hypothetical protein